MSKDIESMLRAKGFRIRDGKAVRDKGICQWASMPDSTVPRCTKPATRQWGGCWFCDEHGRREAWGDYLDSKLGGSVGIEITLPHPGPALRPNGRAHWTDKHRATKAYRALAAAEARLVCGGNPPRWRKATVQIVWNSRTLRHPDPDNVVSSMKAALDGLQDAGVVANDRGLSPERPEIRTRAAWDCVVITVRGA